MNVQLNIYGMGHAVSMLRSIGERVPDAARGQMKRSAQRIVELAQLYVPEDTGDLKKSIRIERSYGENGRLEIDIVAGDETVMKLGGRIINLDQYAALVHEAYERLVAPHGPGPKTLAKMEANPGVHIGSHFLTRAGEDEEPKLEEKLVALIDKIVR